MSQEAVTALRRQARVESQAKQAASREKHLKIAAQLALGGADAVALKEGALRMVTLWQERGLCSPTYIAQWQQILDADLHQVAQNILNMDEAWGPALRQNTPFVVPVP